MPNVSNAARVAAPGLLAGRPTGGACGPESPAQILAQEIAQHLRMQRYEEVSVESTGPVFRVLGYPSGSAALCEVTIAGSAMPPGCGSADPELAVSASVQPTAQCSLHRGGDLDQIGDLHAARVFAFLGRLDGVTLLPPGGPRIN